MSSEQLKQNIRTFYQILFNVLVANVTNTFIWFAVTFWVYLSTQSVIATSFIAGIYVVLNAFSAVFFGAIVDHNKKKVVMLGSSVVSFLLYASGLILFLTTPLKVFSNPWSIELWALVVVLMMGSVVGNLRSIALAPLVTLLFEENKDKANGLVGIATGISFAITSVFSGLSIGFYGMGWSVGAAALVTIVALVHLLTIRFPQEAHLDTSQKSSSKKQTTNSLDLKGTLRLVFSLPGIPFLILFAMFNNFLGGVFMALMDAYGLSLVSVQVWGILLGVLSFAFILGGALVAKYGLGKSPLKTLLIVNMIAWGSCIIFPIQASIILLAFGFFVWMAISPAAEAAEQTVLQTVVPLERQGRVIGFAQSVEQMATPVTAFLIGPLTQLIFIPFMTTGAGVALIGSWFGTGANRGMALVFIVAGLIGLVVAIFARYSKQFKQLEEYYQKRTKTEVV